MTFGYPIRLLIEFHIFDNQAKNLFYSFFLFLFLVEVIIIDITHMLINY